MKTFDQQVLSYAAFHLDSAVACSLAELTAALPFTASITVFLAAFTGGWIIQLIGLHFEGKRPALTDNFTQIFNAPLFLTVEVLFMLGFRKDLHTKIKALRRGPVES